LYPRWSGCSSGGGPDFLRRGNIALKRDLKKAFEKVLAAKCRARAKGAESKKKLLLINPVNPRRVGLASTPSSAFPPLGLGVIAGLTTDDFFVKLIDENFDAFRYEDADLVGLTAFTSSANRAYEIAAEYRQRGIPVVMGGIHASLAPDEALGYADTVLIGEAESVWKNVLDDFLNGRLKTLYRGVPVELKGMPVPRRDIFNDKYLFASIQTSRGCPMDCKFCTVTAFNGEKFRQRPTDEILDELATIPQKYIFFVDDNIIGYGQASEERALDPFRGMIERTPDKKWFCQASLNFGTNDKVLAAAAKSGCKMVFIGLESADPEELRELNKRLNLKLEYERALRRIQEHGIAVLGAFIYGSDRETAESMMRKTDYILKNRIDVIDTTTLTPLPGTKLFRQLQAENRLLFTNFPGDWDHYDMTELTFPLKKISSEEYRDIAFRCAKRLYARRTLCLKFLMTLSHTKSLETALWAYRSNLNFRNVARSIGRTN
jgi:radical SAM superfamily enzyme YgiQ (UPF0313 family)